MTRSVLTRRAVGGLTLAMAATIMGGPLVAQDRLQVAAVNYPLAYFAERLAGDMADVLFNVPADVDPSFWRPGIADITAIQGADLIVVNGAGFADWTARTTLPRSRTVLTSAGFDDAFIATETITHSHGEGGQHSHTGVANYLWLDFAQARLQAEAIAAALTRRAPDASAEIAANLQALSTDLDGLATRAAEIGAAADGVPMIASHPRYQYLARAYGFDISALDWDPRGPVSEDQWAELEAMRETLEARVFIWEAEPDAAALERIEDLGMVNAVFPPLSNRPEQGDFLSVMAGSLDRLDQAVQVASGS
ncbi:metal ABC transporter substrate-binding protein [Hasllibacter sp. MH4015]|uniref:metal ABC transporter substrate-binding protein n=1 Tax=Hasllibacter sp. MH4015 TaxID=2854029 RepID=UPI001CD21991|nr:metal ABC transporter substrate-binding protein [Hasllibacter sp. MH4015]